MGSERISGTSMLCHGSRGAHVNFQGFVVCTEQHSRSCPIFLPGLLIVRSGTSRVQRVDLIDTLYERLPIPG